MVVSLCGVWNVTTDRELLLTARPRRLELFERLCLRRQRAEEENTPDEETEETEGVRATSFTNAGFDQTPSRAFHIVAAERITSPR